MKYFFFTIFFLFLLSLIIVYLNISLPYEKQPQQIIKREEIKEDVNSVLKALANSDTIEGFPAKELYLVIFSQSKLNLSIFDKQTTEMVKSSKYKLNELFMLCNNYNFATIVLYIKP